MLLSQQQAATISAKHLPRDSKLNPKFRSRGTFFCVHFSFLCVKCKTKIKSFFALTFPSTEYLRVCCAAPALWFMLQNRVLDSSGRNKPWTDPWNVVKWVKGEAQQSGTGSQTERQFSASISCLLRLPLRCDTRAFSANDASCVKTRSAGAPSVQRASVWESRPG